MQILKNIAAISLYWPVATVLLAAGWLLPNHYPPWNTFHSNAWIAGILVLILWWWTLRHTRPIRLSSAALFLGLVALIPLAQYVFDILPTSSSAILCTLYLLALAFSFALGESWQQKRPGQSVSFILIAACCASIVSVAIQIYQWLGFADNLALTDIWIFPSAGGSRPYANLGQPNQLASLLLWGLLGALWAAHKGWIGRVGLAAVAAFLLFGLALTESRTAALTLTLAVLTLSVWRPHLLPRAFLISAQAAYVYYLACLSSLEFIGSWLGMEVKSSLMQRTAGETRFAIWQMALDASSQKPWTGFGWNQSNEGFLLVFPNYPQFKNFYIEQSHSLPLDLVLWAGWPIAVLLMFAIACWLWRVVRSITSPDQLIVCSALGVMLIHAMLELPLHYGYFLWPFGVLAGCATAGLKNSLVLNLKLKPVIAGLVALTAAYGVVVHDYFKVESSFAELRFQLLRIGTGHDETPARTFLLNDWPDFIAMTRSTPVAGMTDQEIQRWEDLLLFNTSPLAIKKVVGALVLNGRVQEATLWADRSCALVQEATCQSIKRELLPPTVSP